MHFASRNAGSVSGVILVDPVLPFNHFPVSQRGIVTARNVSASDSGPVIATQQAIKVDFLRHLMQAEFQKQLQIAHRN